MQFANVIIDRKIKELDRCFQYCVPEELISKVVPGSMVLVPLGAGNTPTRAYVVELTDTPEFDVARTKPLLSLVGGRLNVQQEMLILAHWMHQRYGVTMSKALQTVQPIKEEKKRPQRVVYIPVCERERIEAEVVRLRGLKSCKAQLRFLEALLETGSLEGYQVTEELNISAATPKALMEKGFVAKKVLSPGIPFLQGVEQVMPEYTLNAEQKQAVDEIWQEYENGARRPCLLQGITGSGKTEVYFTLIEKTLAEGKQAIMLIPEIALTYQMLLRFYHRFGQRISIIHSKMSPGERYEQYQRILQGEADVVIGPRSALFAPTDRLGIVIVDEEHEDSYKSEQNPKYHAREVAMYRAGLHQAQVVLGSATPSIETNYLAQNGVYRKVRLCHRAKEASQLATTHVVDMRQEMREGNSSILSRTLRNAMAERLERGEQIMLFLNRRGYSNYLACYSCGESLRCPRCDIALTYHQDNSLRCHYCGYRAYAPTSCPSCGVKKRLQPMGIGTQKVMVLVQQAFPEARILRMDQDTTATKQGHQEILEAFSRKEADILLGTQMIVKGHDYENVTLVGVLLADRSLNMPNYRAAEKTFQLLTQAAGRAGRGQKAGDVVIQTYRPEHFAIRAAAKQDYDSFYRQELQYRQMLQYPPTISVMMLQVQGSDLQQVEQVASELATLCTQRGQTEGFTVYGPQEDSIPKINMVYRMNVIIKGTRLDVLLKLRNEISVSKHFTNEQKDVIIEGDVIPGS